MIDKKEEKEEVIGLLEEALDIVHCESMENPSNEILQLTEGYIEEALDAYKKVECVKR